MYHQVILRIEILPVNLILYDRERGDKIAHYRNKLPQEDDFIIKFQLLRKKITISFIDVPFSHIINASNYKICKYYHKEIFEIK